MFDITFISRNGTFALNSNGYWITVEFPMATDKGEKHDAGTGFWVNENGKLGSTMMQIVGEKGSHSSSEWIHILEKRYPGSRVYLGMG